MRYAAMSAGALYCLHWLYRHSALAGSDDLGKWSRAAAEAAAASWRVGGWGLLASASTVPLDVGKEAVRRSEERGYRG